MTELLTARAYGRSVGLAGSSADLESVIPWLPHWWDLTAPAVTPEKTWTVPSAAGAEWAVAELELWVAEHAADLIFIHTGVVAINGRALLLPGRSMAGKTTLTAALVRAGATYGSDEYAPITQDGLIHPYPRPLWMRFPDGRRQVPVSELGGETFSDPVPLGGIALLRYVAGSAWEVSALSPGEAVLGLVDNCVPARSRPEEMLEALTRAVPMTGLIRGTRGDVDEAVARLFELVG